MELVSAGKPAACPAFQMEMRTEKKADNEGYMEIKLNKRYLHINSDLFWLALCYEKHFRDFIFLHVAKNRLSIKEGDKTKVLDSFSYIWSSCL